MRENQNIAHCSVCSEKTHCRFSFPYIPHRLHSTESKFHSFLSLNLPNNMGDIWTILIQNGCRFITHSPTISNQLVTGDYYRLHNCFVSQLDFSPFILTFVYFSQIFFYQSSFFVKHATLTIQWGISQVFPSASRGS